METSRRPVADLSPALKELADTRAALHRLIAYTVSPAREALTGRIGLRAAPGAIATPLFGDDEIRVAIEGDELVRAGNGSSERRSITTLTEAADFLAVELDATRSQRVDVPPIGNPDEKLAVDADASRWLAAWFGFGDSVLEGMRAGATAEEDVTVPQLWPEHFDIAIVAGVEDRGQRANYGFSPGDNFIDEPYLYVGPWNTDGLDDEFWEGETWAPMRLNQLLDTDDRRASALAFLRQGRDVLRSRVRRMGHL